MSTSNGFPIGSVHPYPIGTTVAGSRSYEYLEAESRLRRPPPPETPLAPLSTREAIARVKEEKLRGHAAVGRLCSLTGDGAVDAELALRASDQETVEAAKSVFMKDGAATFFAPVPKTFAANEFSPATLARIAMRTSDSDGRGNVNRR